MSRRGWAHVRDEEYRSHLWRALEQLHAALSGTAIDYYAAEKLDNAELAIQAARRRLLAVTGCPEDEVREMAVILTTLGSRGLTVNVAASALDEAGPGGVQVTLGLYDGPLTIQFTRREALWLWEELRVLLVVGCGP